MKKLLLLSAVSLLSVAAFAQKPVKVQTVKMPVVNMMKSAKQAQMTGKLAPVAVRKSAANGVYYTRPAGSMYTYDDTEGMGFYVQQLIVAPGSNVTFKNASTASGTPKWTINGSDASDYADAEGNLTYFDEAPIACMQRGYGYYNPQLTIGSNSYVLGEYTKYYKDYGPSLLSVDSIYSHAVLDNRVGGYAFGGAAHPVSATDTVKYLYGTGTFYFNDGGSAKNLGIIQYGVKPMSPLYVEDIHSLFYTAGDAVFADDNAHMDIYVMSASQDDEGNWAIGTDTIAHLVATKASATQMFEPQETKYGTVAGDMVVFKQKGVDELGAETDVPFVIDQPYALVLEGFQNAGVNCGIVAIEENAADALNPGCEGILDFDGEQQVGSVYGGGALVWSRGFTGAFDKVSVAQTLYTYDDQGNVTDTYENMNVLRVSADGQTVETDGMGENGLGAAFVQTAFSWYTPDQEANYVEQELPDWIQSLNVTVNDAENHVYYVKPVCDPLPDGVTGRGYRIYLQGKGVASEYPIVVLQGDATVADAINNVEITENKDASNKIYNVAGQQVNAAYKGIVIKNGKKFINK